MYHVYGLENVRSNGLVEFENGVKGAALNLEESNVGVVLLNNVNKVTENMSVRRTGEIASIPVGEGLLGTVRSIFSASRSMAKDRSSATVSICRSSVRLPA